MDGGDRLVVGITAAPDAAKGPVVRHLPLLLPLPSATMVQSPKRVAS